MDIAEVEFIAEKELITIIPNFTHQKFTMISGDFGPFKPGIPVEVPLWMGINMKQSHKCKIVCPEWMDVQKLEELKEQELRSRLFIKMPDHFIVIAQLLISTASEDIPNSEEVKMLIKDIWDVRNSKLRASIDAFIKSGGTHARLDHLTLFEIHSVRPLLTKALVQLDKLSQIHSEAMTQTQD